MHYLPEGAALTMCGRPPGEIRVSDKFRKVTCSACCLAYAIGMR